VEIVTTQQPRNIRLTKAFLAPYYKRKDPFNSILSKSTYLTKYCRDEETWTDTIRRVVEGNVNETSLVTRAEAEKLFHSFWTCQLLPPGRGLWTGGVPGIPAAARYNCYYLSLKNQEDWLWLMDMSMLGGGVGFGLLDLSGFPTVSAGQADLGVYCSPTHPNAHEVNDSGPGNVISPMGFPAFVKVVPDTRQGWVDALRELLNAAFRAESLCLDLSNIRERGAPLKTFGGVACGPGPLAHLLRSVWSIIRGAQGRRMTRIECLDVTNLIGYCVKSGNVRRTALLALGPADDQDYRNAKKDLEKVAAFRHTSNNSVVFDSLDQIEGFNWLSLVEDNSLMGEPGFFNRWLARQTDPLCEGINPCAEIIMHDREACNLAEIFPALFEDETRRQQKEHFKLLTRYCLRQRLAEMHEPVAESVRKRNMRLGVGLGGVCDFAWKPQDLSAWYTWCREEANAYADDLKVNRPIAVTTVKPSGTISLLSGSSPGMHAPFAPFYVRRTQLAKSSHLAQALMEAGVPSEPSVQDSSGNTLVFSFPMRGPSHATVTTQTETLEAQLERQCMLQTHWSDNSVSATLSFDAATEKQQMAALLKTYAPKLKSVSMLPKAHGYEQAPYEAITESQYAELYAGINHAHPLTRGEDMIIEECANGICPVR
jgi:ribonucleoside-diphosphate reductase alpha chain/ribonucleoside-triphosphate reductase